MILSTLLPAKAAAALVGAGALVLGGGAVAAYAGVLPPSLQGVAHAVVGAPAADDQGDQATESPDPSTSPEPSDEAKTADPSESPDPSVSPQAAGASSASAPDPSTSPSPHGPDATGPAAFGLCNAHAHGGLPDHSTAYQALAAAASAAATAAAGTAPPAPAGATPAAPTDPVDAYCATVLNPTGAASPTASVAPSADSTAGPGHKHAKVHPNKKTSHPNHGHGGSH